MVRNIIKGCIWILMLLLLIANSVNADGCTSNDPTAPCFANNDDILAGTRDLLPVDDLLLSSPVLVNPHEQTYNFSHRSLKTKDLAVDSVSNTAYSTGCTPPFQARLQSLIGRMFAMPNDVWVSLRSLCDVLELVIFDELDSSNKSITQLSDSASSIDYVGIAMADFNRDGYQDIIYIGDNTAQAFTAKCTGDPFNDCTQVPSDDLSSGPALSLDSIGPYAGAPVTGDFNSDGVVDVAWPAISDDNKVVVQVVSVCPAAGNVGILSCSEALEIVPVQTIDLNAPLNLTGKSLSRPTIDIGAGNFDGLVDTDTGRADDELVVALADQNNSNVTVSVYDYDASTSRMVSKKSAGPFDIEHNNDKGAQVFIEGVQLDPNSLQYQAAFSYTKKGGSVPHRGVVTAISFDELLNMTVRSTVLANSLKTRIWGMAVGRFDPPANVSTGAIDFSNQIALLISHDDSDTQIQFFRAPSATTFTPKEVSDSRINIASDFYLKDSMQLSALTAGDLQGRSLILGAPDIITISSTQLDVAVSAPPMHVDFIRPLNSEEPEILNVSVFPETYNAGFEFENSSEEETEHEGSTSYGVGLKIEGSQKWKEGTKSNNTSFEIRAAASGSYEKSVEKFHNTYNGKSYSLSSETEFDDLVVATALQLNIYSYPIIGQLVCPDETPNCSDDEKQQLIMQYSGPDNIVYTNPANGSAMEWYQPVTEPGNIFSYPGSLAILKTNERRALTQDSGVTVPDIDLLTPEGSLWDSQSKEAVSIQWTAGSGGGRTTDVTRAYAFDVGATLKTKTGVKDVYSSKFEISGDLETNLSFASLNTNKHSFDATLGVKLKRGLGVSGDVSSSEFLYQGASYIYGLHAVDGSIAPSLGLPNDSTVENTKTYAPFKVGHVANMLSEGLISSGNWWKLAYAKAPDIALNHPQRWFQRRPEGSVQQLVRFSCPIGFESTFEDPVENEGSCVANEDEPTTRNVVTAAFYKMKGFFVTQDDNTNGPTISLATLGDTVTLQARVYNYSLANMPAGATVHIRFYAQAWDPIFGEFENFNGDDSIFKQAQFIGELALVDPVPAFCGGSQGFDSCSTETEPNWVMVPMQWDTSAISPQPTEDTHWKFWVVVWMEDSSGELVEEIESHGLTAVPFVDVDSFAEIPIETYSNNLGYYNQMFSLLLPAVTAPAPVSPAPVERDLVIKTIETNLDLFKKHVPSTIRVHFQASGEHYDGVNVLLFEGDSAEGELLDMESIPRMSKDEPTVVVFPYVPKTCGEHSLFIQTFQSDGNDPITETITFEVPCKPSFITDFKGNAKVADKDNQQSYVLNLRGEFELHRANSLPGIDLAVADAEVTLHSLLAEVGGNGELVENMPLVLLAGPVNSDDFAVYETLSGSQPSAKLKVKKLKSPGAYSFNLKVKHAAIASADSCPSTGSSDGDSNDGSSDGDSNDGSSDGDSNSLLLLTSFTIEDGGSIPVHVVTDATWGCNGKSGSMKTE